MIWKTTITFIAALFLSIGSYAQNTPDLRECTNPNGTIRWNCPSNNFTLDNVYLSLVDENGNPIDTKSCNSGEQETAYVYLNYTSNANSPIEQTRVFADLVIEGNRQDLNVYLGQVLPANQGSQTSEIFGPFTWECGTELRLENILIVWNPTFDNKTSENNYDCSSYGKSQCEFGTDTFIAAPLAVQFDYTVCRENGTTTVNYSSTTNGGKAPYIFQWDFTNDGSIDNNTANPQFTTTETGDFTTELTVIDDQGTESSFTVLIDNPSELNITGDITNINCDASTLGSIDITIIGGTEPYLVGWTGPDSFTSSAEDLTDLEAGTYEVTVEDKFGCTYSSSFEVEQDQKPTANAGSDKELTCTQTSVTLDGSGSSTNLNANLTYSWSGPNSYSASTEDITISNPGMYTLTVTDSDNGCSATDTVVVTQDDNAPNANITGNEELTCANTEITLDASASTVQGTASYSWTLDSANGTEVGTSATLNVDAPGTYFVTVTDSDNGCSASTSVTVAQDITPVVADITGNQELTCTTTEIILDASASTVQGTASYSWTLDSANGTEVGTSATLNVDAPGTYFVTVTDSDNGCSASTSVTVAQDITPVVADITGNQELTCTTTEIILDASASTVQGTASYSWTLDSANGTEVGTGATLNVDAPGTYFVTVTDSDNGCSASTSVTVAQDITPVVADITGNQELTCTTTEIILDASASTVQGTASYSWTMNTADGTQVGTGATLDVDAPGTYFVTVTDSDNGCSASTSVTVAQDITPVVADITGNQELTCTTTEIILDASASTVQGTASYSWTMNTADGTQVGTGATLDVDAPGTYFVTVTDSDNGCSASTSVTVAQDITPVVADITGNQELTCTTTEITLDGSGSTLQGTASYSWTLDTADGTQVGTGATLDVDAPGTYFVTVTDSDNGCSASTSVTVAQDITPVVADITGNQELTCTTTEITLDASASTVQGTASYSWTKDEDDTVIGTNETLSVSETGVYYVTVTDSDNGCSASTSVTVAQDITPVVADITGNQELTCTTTEITLDASSSTVQETASYSWTKDGDNTVIGTNETLSVSETGVYYVTVTDSDNGCSDITSVEVTQDGNVPTAAITGNDELTCTTTEITLDASTSIVQGTASYSWTLNTADGTQVGTGATLDVDAPGTYFVTVTDSDNGCSASTSVTVAQDITPVVADITGNQELTCTTTEITLDASASTVQGTASYSWTKDGDNTVIGTNETLSVSETGVYYVTVTDSDNGCSASTSVTVAQDITPVVADITGNQELTCTTTEITLDASASTVQGTASYSWTLNAADGTQVGTGATLDVDAPGTYFVTVTDSDNGCSASTSVTVAQDITPVVADITGNQELTCTTTEITLDASASTVQGTASYSWTKDGDNTVIGTNETLSVSETGVYYVTVTDSDNGCFDTTSVEVSQDVLSVEAIITGNEDLDCNNTSVILDAGSSTVQSTATYLWSTGETSESIEVTEAGEYTVTVTDNDNGCSDEISVILNFIEDTEPPLITDCAVEVNVSADAGTCEASGIDLGMPIATDNCPAELTIENNAPEVFPLGQTIVTWTITDASKNSTQCEQIVNVTDDQAPVITECAALVTVSADAGVCFATEVDLGMPMATDNCDSVLSFENNAPEIFELGETTITWTITDASGNSVECNQTVIVTDDENPVVEAIDDININSDPEICGAIVNFETIIATDNCEINTIEVTEGLSSGSEFPVGTTTVSITVTDMSGNTTTVSFDVNVTDNETPEISCPANMTVDTETGVSYATVDFDNATATDNCNVTVEQTAGPVSGSQFEIGTTTITFTATDDAGNTSECSFTITVEDNEDPTITCPADIDLTNDAGVCGAVVEFSIPEFSDNSGFATIQQTAGLESGEVFPVGTTTVSYTVTDKAGNSASCSFDVTVTDNEAPVLEDMNDITMNNDNGVCGAVIEFGSVAATDNCAIESVVITEGFESGSEFPVGTTTVTYTVTDINGNVSTESFTVTVNDNEAPAISCPSNMTVSTETNVSYATVNFDNATATDNCEVTVEQTAGPVSGSQFEIGTTTVTFTATDAAGNTSECSFTVTVEDNEDPTLTCPANIEESNDEGICGAVIEFATPEFADNSGDATIEQTAGPASGEVFPVGTTTVTYQVTDAAGNTAECSFTVTITDDEVPSIEQRNNIIVGNDEGSCGAVVNFLTPEATDNCGIESVSLTEGLESGSEFPNGTTTVVFTATDTHGNTATSTFTVTVNDTEAPSIECPENISVTVENGTETVVVEYTSVSTTDNCEGTTVVLTEGLASGEAFSVGETTITYTVTDAAGNSTNCSFTVTVEEEELPTPPAAPSVSLTQPTCAVTTGTITVETQTGLTYSIDGENFQESGVFADLAPGLYDVVAQDEFGQISEFTTVEINEPVAEEITLVNNGVIDLCIEDSSFDLFELFSGEFDDSGVWVDTNNTGALSNGSVDPSLLALGSYTFEYQVSGNCPSNTEVTVLINDDCVVLDCSIEDIKDGISKAVTPNGDGKNDVFKVDLDLACGFTYNVKIFNRWGAKVLDAQNYQNNWDGYSDSSFSSSNQLPSGTYFYVLEIREGTFEPIQGYIYLGTK